MRWLLPVALVGCTLPETHHKPNCGSEYCDASEVCDKTDPSGVLVCLPADGDLDGDGIPNGADFCEHVAGGATDEDGDGIGDVCDACPIAPPPATPDPDGDAVDSPCDPDPRTGGDTILFFDGFNNGLDPNWKPTTASAWTLEGGEMVVTLTGLPNPDFLQMGVIAKMNLAVEASYRVDNVDPSASDHLVVVGGSDPRPAGVATMECGLEQNDTAMTTQVTLTTNLSGAGAPATNAFNTASLYEIGAYDTGANVGCTALGDAQAIGVVQAQISPDSLTSIAIGARGVTARFQWVLAVGRD